MVVAILVILGLIFGSFVNALVWRLHENKDWVRARSQCPKCGHVLAGADLIPVFSWLLLKGRCRYCKKAISAQYPVVELAMASVFGLSYIFWPKDLGQTGNLLLFVTWLISAVGLMALLVYDLKWMLLPNKLIYSTLCIAVAGHLIYLVGFSADKPFYILNWLLSVAIASGVFWLLFIISEGKWIGFGDVRLGLITGTLLHKPALSLMMIFLGSLLGTLFVLPSLITGRRGVMAKLPYGPFLIAAAFICLLFGADLSNWYASLLGAN